MLPDVCLVCPVQINNGNLLDNQYYKICRKYFSPLVNTTSIGMIILFIR